MTITEDYRAGYKAGQTDKLNGHRSDYLWYSFATESQTLQDYSLGYHDGWNYGRTF